MLLSGQAEALQAQLSDVNNQLALLRRENADLRVEAERGRGAKSAMASNNQAIAERIETTNKQLQEKE